MPSLPPGPKLKVSPEGQQIMRAGLRLGLDAECRQGRSLSLLACALLAAFGCAQQGQAQTATTTTLTLTSGGSPATTVPSGTAVTLTATVTGGGFPLRLGQVNFCDATAASCSDIHLLATAQITSAATATFKFVPAVGSHSYKAVFLGTDVDATSESGAVDLTVTHSGLYQSASGIAESGSVGDYSLTATVGGNGSAAPTGTVSFLDATNGNALLGTASLGAGSAGLSFVNSATPAVGNGPHAIAAADFNGDGILDLAVTSYGACPATGTCANGTVTVLLGNGDGTFTASPASPATGINPISIATGDFNGDGIPDLAVANAGGCYVSNFTSCPITVLLGNGDGTFTGASTNPDSDADPLAIVVGDFNGDGKEDLAVLDDNGTCDLVTTPPYCSPSALIVWYGNGDGTFTNEVTAEPGNNPTGVVPGYFSADGVEDLAVIVPQGAGSLNDPNTDYDYVDVLLGSQSDSFTSNVTFLSNVAGPSSNIGTPSSIAAADFNGDGNVDLAVGNDLVETSGYGALIQVLLGNGTGAFTLGADTNTAAVPASMVVGDFNGDGIPDLAVAENNQTVQILLGNGDGTFTVQTASLATDSPVNSMVTGDFNGEGFSDLAVAGSGVYGVTLLSPVTETASATSSGGIALQPGTGIHQIVASYAGDSNYKPSISGSVALTAATIMPSVVVKASPNPVALGGSDTLTATVSGTGAAPTGTVTFLNGATPVGEAALSSTGTAAIMVGPFLTAGLESIAAEYSGDIHYAATISQGITLQALPGTPTLSLTSSTASIIQGGSPATFTATVSGAGVKPTGTVTFLDGTATLNTSTLSADVASFSINALAFGVHSITAAYSGDSNYTAATSAAVSLNVTGGATPTFTLAASATSVPYGTAFSFKAAASGSSGTPTGTVTFFNGATPLGMATLNSSGVATYSTMMPVGLYGITASYVGDNNYAAATSNSVSVGVNKATPAVTLTLSASSVKLDTHVTMTATVKRTGVTPTGTVTFFDGTTPDSTVTLNSSGVATLTAYTAGVLGVGKHSLSASYAGDTNYTAADSNVDSLTVNLAIPVAKLTSSPTSTTYGDSITLAAALTGALGTPTGRIQFFDGDTLLGAFNLSNAGIATHAEKLAAGEHSIMAFYEGSAVYAPADSNTLKVKIGKATPAVAIKLSPSTAKLSQPITFTVIANGAGAKPTGIVTILNGEKELAIVTLNDNGEATFRTSKLTAGKHSITAAYAGNADYKPATSVPVTITISAD